MWHLVRISIINMEQYLRRENRYTPRKASLDIELHIATALAVVYDKRIPRHWVSSNTNK